MPKIVIGSVPYSNARPLVEWFYQTDAGKDSGIEVVEVVPSRLLGLLERGEVTVALLSSVTALTHPEWDYVPGIGIVSDGPVLSVRLFSRMPIANIQTVALDVSSLTSVNLVKIILRERYGIQPRFLSGPPSLTAMLAENDAALLIGDPGFGEYGREFTVLDLGEEWRELTGLPFVYALWLGRPEYLTPELTQILQEAKEWGRENTPAIAHRQALSTGKSAEWLARYMGEAIRYEVTPRAVEGFELFRAKCREHGLPEGVMVPS